MAEDEPMEVDAGQPLTNGHGTATSSNQGKRKSRNAVVRQTLESVLKKQLVNGISKKVPQRPIKIGSIHYWENDMLGNGATGVVYNGYHEVETKHAAVKMMSKSWTKYFDREINVLQWIITKNENAHLVRYFAREIDERNYFIAMEKAECTLFNVISPGVDAGISTVTKEDLSSILKQTALGLQAMHCYKRKYPIVHRDIKPANILLFESRDENDGRFTAKIADFGISKELKNLHSSTTRPEGTIDWMSPERLAAYDDEQTEYKATLDEDIFCFGMMVYWAMTRGEHPFGVLSDRMYNLKRGRPIYQKKDKITRDNFLFVSLVNSMCALKGGDRPGIMTVLKHPFFWTLQEKLSFITAASNALAKQNGNGVGKVRENLEKRVNLLCKCPNGSGWVCHLADSLQNLIRSREKAKPNAKRYNGNGFMSLIEFIRDKFQHRAEWTDEVRGTFSVGGSCTGAEYMKYFDDMFPLLIPVLFLEIQEYVFNDCRDDDLKEFYSIPQPYVFKLEAVQRSNNFRDKSSICLTNFNLEVKGFTGNN